MLKKVIFFIAAACCFSCLNRKPGLIPSDGPAFRSMSIKFDFREGAARQNGRLHLRFDDRNAKILFFTPLNQVALELDVEGEEAVLIHFAKKAYWQGDFMVLLERLWNIKLGLAQMKRLLVAGEVPQAEFDEQGIVARMENHPGTGAPETARLLRGDASLTLRISRSELRPGRIVLIDYRGRYRAAELETVLGDD